VDDRIGRLAVADEQAQPALAVEHVAAGRVVDGVAARLLARHLRVEHLEFLGHFRGLLGRAAQADEALVEGRHVGGQQFLGVALGVEGDEQHLHLVGLRSQLLHHAGHFGHRGRADVRALGIAEEHHHHLALEVGQGARLAGVVGQREALGVIEAGDVGVLEAGGLLARQLVAAGEGAAPGRWRRRGRAAVFSCQKLK
jgi:hypothetical protein